MSTGASVGASADATTDQNQGDEQSGAVEDEDTTTAAEPEVENGQIADGDVFEVLSNQRRRYTLHYLMQHADEPTEMGELSTQIAAWEAGVDPAEVTYEQRKSVHTSLYQYHAPKLDDTGFVEYDSRRGVVELTAAGSDVDLYLEAVRGREIPWASYFVAFSIVATVLVSAAWLDVPPLAALPAFACAGFVSAALLVSSLVFAYDTRTAMRLGSAGPPPEVREG